MERKDLNKILERRRNQPNKLHKIGSDRIGRIQKKKIQTTMIGAIAAFEDAFGDLWGQGSKNKTEDQKKMSELWEKTREKILDNGNAQIRALQKELETYSVSWNRYRMTMNARRQS